MSINAVPVIAVPFEVIQQCQVSRTALVSLLGDHETMRQTVVGCLARVLLEIEQNQEDYRIFAIRDIVPGQPYSGFTNDPAATTSLYVDLDLPPRLRGLNGAVFQLNSVSNSAMTPDEYRVWLQNTSPDNFPSPAEWRNRAAKIGALPHPRKPARPQAAPAPGVPSGASSAPAIGGGAAAAPAPPPLMQTIVPGSPGMLGATSVAGGGGGGGSSVAPDVFDVPSMDQIRRQVMDEIRVKHAVFPTAGATDGLKTATLRTHERDLADYVEKIKEILNSTSAPCVVCMDRECTVVTLPCKHKVLCRLCATQVTRCPLCRETTLEIFEPIEQ